MSGIAGLVSAGMGIFGGLSGKDSASGVQMPSMFQMSDMPNAARNAFTGIAGLPGQQIPGQVLDQYQQYVQSALNNPYAQQFQQGANNAAGYGQANAMGAFGAGQQFQQAGAGMIPGAQRIMDTAFDPQNQLYQRTQQQLVDQTRAGQAARGVATTPYGAAGEADAMRKFDIDWQNAQLGRQAAGAQAAGGLLGDSLRTSAGGSAMASTGANEYGAFGGMPFNAFNQISQAPLQPLNSLLGATGQAQGIGLNPVNAYLQYLGVGNQAGGVANQNAQVGLNQAKLGFDQNQTLGSNLGTSIAGLGSTAGKAFGGGGFNPGAAFPGATSGWNWLSSFGG